MAGRYAKYKIHKGQGVAFCQHKKLQGTIWFKLLEPILASNGSIKVYWVSACKECVATYGTPEHMGNLEVRIAPKDVDLDIESVTMSN